MTGWRRTKKLAERSVAERAMSGREARRHRAVRVIGRLSATERCLNGNMQIARDLLWDKRPKFWPVGPHGGETGTRWRPATKGLGPELGRRFLAPLAQRGRR